MFGSNKDLEDERIWIEKSKVDTRHFAPLYNKYYEPLYRFFLRRTDDSLLADDLCSATFFKALDNLKKFKWQGKPFGAWLFRIGANELNKHFRAAKPVFIVEADKLNCTSETMELVGDDQLDHLFELLDELEETELRILELKFFEDQSFKQIGALLDMGESAVKMRLYRLLSKLRTQLNAGA